MIKDLLEATAFALITNLFLGLLGAALVFAVWIAVCRYLRRQELDSDFEHINHNRHGKTYQN